MQIVLNKSILSETDIVHLNYYFSGKFCGKMKKNTILNFKCK